MGFFKDVKKAYKTGQKAQKQYQKAVPQTPKVSSPPPPHTQPVPQVDPAWLSLAYQIPIDGAGTLATKIRPERATPIGIVGEQWRHGNIQGVINAGGDKGFHIYLINDYANEHDSKAVGVYSAALLLGYIPKDENKIWHKLVKEAADRHEVLWGQAKAYKRKDGYWQVDASVYHPSLIAPSEDSLEPKKMTPAAIAKNIQILEDAANADPDTVAQAKSWAKKAAKAAEAFYSHSLWVLEQGEDEDWEDIQSEASVLLQNAEYCAFMKEPEDYFELQPEDLLRQVEDLK